MIMAIVVVTREGDPERLPLNTQDTRSKRQKLSVFYLRDDMSEVYFLAGKEVSNVAFYLLKP